MKIKKIHSFNYQRNGVAGKGFYVALFDWYAASDDKGKGFIATFCTNESDSEIEISSCRIVDPINLLECWRGDQFAYSFNDFFKASGVDYFYDLKEMIAAK